MSEFYMPKTKPPSTPRVYSFCRLCKAKIFWTVTEKRKNMPVEYDEKLLYLFDGITKVYYEKSMMTPHWSKCPHADKFRKD